MELIEALESGRQDFMDAVSGLSESASLLRPAPDRWSVVECIEHVVTVEERFQGWLEKGSPAASLPNPENEARLFSVLTDRSTRVTAPEAVRPSGRFRTLQESLAGFIAARDRSLSLVKDRASNLYTIGAQHQRFGDLNGVEVVQLIAGHARRHAAQIRETRNVVERD